MDISVLTEQRREMVIDLLKNMKIRKSDGEGFDKDDVYACMQQLCDVYEKSIDDLTVSYETELGELQDKYQKYDENNDLYISLIMEAKKSSNEIINKAKSEVDEILAEGREQIAAQQEEIERMRVAADQEKADLNAELEAAREAAVKEKAQLAEDVEAEKRQVEVVREQYRDQVAVMDQEFDEIKTNILRTAGKIDGLKAQLESAREETEWQLQDEPAAPAPVAEEAAEEAEAPEEMSFEDLVARLQQEDAAKAGQVAEVEAPAETLAIEPEIEVPAPEAPVEEAVAEPEPEEPVAEPEPAPLEEFNFQPVFGTTQAAPIQEEAFPEVAVQEEVPAEPAFEGPYEEPALDIPEVDVPVEEKVVQVPADIPLDVSFEEDIDALGSHFDVEQLHFVAADGYANHMRDTMAQMDDATFDIYLHYHFATCERPDMIGLSHHTLDIFRKN